MTPDAIGWCWGFGIIGATGVLVGLEILLANVATEIRLARVEKHRATFAQARVKEAEWAAQQAKSAAVVEVARARRGEVPE